RHERLHPLLKQIGDTERTLARVGLRSARPRDLARLRDALATLPALQAELAGSDTQSLTELAARISSFPEQAALLEKALMENPPVVIREGGVIAEGYDAELDELRNLSANAGEYLV